MLASIATYFTGRAAKAGAAALVGLIGAPGAMAGIEFGTGADLEMTLLGYLVVGLLQGGINWAAAYFTTNKGAVNGVFPARPGGLY